MLPEKAIKVLIRVLLINRFYLHDRKYLGRPCPKLNATQCMYISRYISSEDKKLHGRHLLILSIKIGEKLNKNLFTVMGIMLEDQGWGLIFSSA